LLSESLSPNFKVWT